MVKRIARFSVHRTSLTIGAFYGVLGLVAWPIVLLSQEEKPPLVYGLPIAFAVFGYLMIAAYCLIYNVIARWTGGLEFEVRDAAER
jgi:hypothetical protein